MPCRTNLPDNVRSQLIEEVRARPSLYDKSDPNYQSQFYNGKMWEEIGAALVITGT